MTVKIDRYILFVFFVALTPLFYKLGNGFVVGNLFAFILNILILLGTKRILSNYLHIAFFVVSSLLYMYSLNLSDGIAKSNFFIFFIIYVFVLRSNVELISDRCDKIFRMLNTLFYIYIVVTLSYFVLNIGRLFNDFEYRFDGFSQSATTFSLVFLSFYCVFLYYEKINKVRTLLISILVFTLIYLSGTRTSLLIFFIVSFLRIVNIYYPVKSKVYRILFFFFVFITVLLYPTYSFLQSSDLKIAKRESNVQGQDASSITRLYFTGKMIENINSSNLKECLIGKGVNYSVDFITTESKEYYKVEPHNDFLLLINDYGLIYFILFMILIFKGVFTSFLSSSIVIVYLSSFYHNMVFNTFMIFILLLSKVALSFNLNKSMIYEE